MHLSGINSLSEIDKVIGHHKVSKVLLVTGKDSFSSCGAQDQLIDIISAYDITFFNDFEINPKYKDAIKGAKLAQQNSIELIIAIGGGSVIDMAKLIKALYGNHNSAKEIIQGALPISNNSIPLIAIPTTAGSGSESTHFAVVYVSKDKYSLADLSLLPSSTILDGALTLSASRYQKACNVLDAVSQSIESAWAVNATIESQKYSFEALDLCIKYSQKYVNSDNPIEYCQPMIEASNLAGKAINISKTTAAHAWSYALSSKYNIPHGHAVWLTLPKIFEIHNSTKINNLEKTMTKLRKILLINSGNDIQEYFNTFLKSLGIKKKNITDFNFSIAERVKLSQSVNEERMSNNPVVFSQKDIKEIFFYK